MPSIETSFAVATVNLVTEKRNCKVKPSLLVIDNVNGAADAVITMNDVFTPSITNGVPIPVLTTVPRLHMTVAAGECVSIGAERELRDVEFLGLVQIVRGALDAGSFATLAYDLI